jgi:DNA-binding transcriptional regulator/RsmH inhibitor MraZ
VENTYGCVQAPVDKQGRVKLPLGFSAAVLPERFVFVSADPRRRFLEVRSEAAFVALADRVREVAAGLPPDAAAALVTEYLGGAHRALVDDAVRVALPGRFRDVVPGPEAVLVAIGDAVLVWDRAAYEAGQPERLAAIAAGAPGLDPVLLDIAR